MENLPPTIFIAIGVIVAAFISGFWSLINMVISKDQKVSEFRQSWIDSLRSDVAEYDGHLSSFSAAWSYYSKKHSGEEAGANFIKDNLERICELESCKNKIYLRLNPEEHTNIITILDDLDRLIETGTGLESETFSKSRRSLIKEIQTELKFEWERVKSGEKSFRYLRNFSFFLATTTSLLILWKLYG